MKELNEIRCPSCGEIMEKGGLFGFIWRIRWSTKERKYLSSTGEPLGERYIWSMPKLQAAKCHKCQIGIFKY
jgi:DNA-directed RNA polymerase subunit RPC12/RpoP